MADAFDISLRVKLDDRAGAAAHATLPHAPDHPANIGGSVAPTSREVRP